MRTEGIARRRVLVSAVAAGIVGGCTTPRRFEWHGTALGADASLVLVGRDQGHAAAAIKFVLDEIDRLEREFSLYRPDSNLVRLIREGRLVIPSPDWRVMLTLARRLHLASHGAFDVTIQPLWAAIAGYLAQDPHANRVPDDIVNAARAYVGMARVQFDDTIVALQPGMALTFNGIAQGYVCDRVADLLRSMGWADVLVHLGEIRAAGSPEPGQNWSVEVPSGRSVALAHGAVATSAGSAARLDAGGRFHHLIDPRTAESPKRFSSVTAIATSAAVADGVSTAATFLPPQDAFELAQSFGAALEILTADRRVVDPT